MIGPVYFGVLFAERGQIIWPAKRYLFMRHDGQIPRLLIVIPALRPMRSAGRIVSPFGLILMLLKNRTWPPFAMPLIFFEPVKIVTIAHPLYAYFHARIIGIVEHPAAIVASNDAVVVIHDYAYLFHYILDALVQRG